MKKIVKKILRLSGYELRKINPFLNTEIKPGSDKRVIGDMGSLLEDLKSRGLNCKFIMDIGANKAGWSNLAKNIFPDAAFCLIEPQIELETYLKPFCNATNNSIYYIAGAGIQKGKKYLTIWEDTEGSSFLPAERADLKRQDKQREIDIVSISDIIESGKFAIPELIKIDVQGFELEALKGGNIVFGKTEIFILEVSLFSFLPGMPVLSDIVTFMLEKEYMIYDFPGFLRRPKDGALGQCDICFVKKEGLLRRSNAWE